MVPTVGRERYYIHKQIGAEHEFIQGKNLSKELFTVLRNRLAAQRSFFYVTEHSMRVDGSEDIHYRLLLRRCGNTNVYLLLGTAITLPDWAHQLEHGAQTPLPGKTQYNIESGLLEKVMADV